MDLQNTVWIFTSCGNLESGELVRRMFSNAFQQRLGKLTKMWKEKTFFWKLKR